MQEGSGACGARVQAAFGLVPWAARVPPTERAGSEGSVLCCLSAAPPLVADATTLPAGKRVTGFSDIGPDIYRKAPLWAG